MHSPNLLKELHDIARQYFSGNRDLSALFDAQLYRASMIGHFDVPELDTALMWIEFTTGDSLSYGIGMSLEENKAVRQDRFIRGLKAWADKATEKQPVTARYKGTGTVSGPLKIPKRVLVKRCRPYWPGIESDLKDAATNGLAGAAKAADGRGWFEHEAMQWAASRGKLNMRPGGIISFVFSLGDK